ncbi:hypothetical protein GHO36_25465, partial [Pseudomonas sp. FSL R10-2398]|nr:hypothetical protein [Pseudomonas sp. FSL R10-2398]
MAIYSASVKTVSRGSGRSATAAAAYRNGEEITDLRTGEVHDYRRRTGVEHVASFAPEGMTPQPSAELWNRAEAAEVRKNARVAREVLVALPAELSPTQRRELAVGIAQALADRYGTAGTLAVHTPDREGDQRNHHAHILMTTRRLEPTGELGEKTRELDDVKRGPQEIEWVRAMIEARTNHALERAGSEARVDRRSLVEQRAAALASGELERAVELDRLPTIHEGPRVTAIRRECERKQRAPLGNVTRLEVNNDRRQLSADRTELGNVSAQIINIEQARAARAAREQVAGAASAGMEAFKARFQHSQDMAARIEAERARLTAEVQRVAQERAAEQTAQERAQEQERAAKAPKHVALSNEGPVKRGRSGPDFSM